MCDAWNIYVYKYLLMHSVDNGNVILESAVRKSVVLFCSSSLQGRDTSDQHIIEVVLKMLQGECLDLNIHL